MKDPQHHNLPRVRGHLFHLLVWRGSEHQENIEKNQRDRAQKEKQKADQDSVGKMSRLIFQDKLYSSHPSSLLLALLLLLPTPPLPFALSPFTPPSSSCSSASPSSPSSLSSSLSSPSYPAPLPVLFSLYPLFLFSSSPLPCSFILVLFHLFSLCISFSLFCAFHPFYSFCCYGSTKNHCCRSHDVL